MRQFTVRLRQEFQGAPGAWFAAGFLLFLGVFSLLAPLLPLDPTGTDVSNMNASPSAEHWFGTDEVGRDYFARVVFGGRISLLVGLLAMAAAVFIGVVVGVIAGFAGGWIDSILMRFVDFLAAIPWIVLVIVLGVFFRPGLTTIIFVIGCFTWMSIARLVRAETLSIKERPYVGYASFIGTPNLRIIGTHILPAATATIIIAATSTISAAMLTEAALSFLGLGIQQPMASWGSLLQTAQGSLQRAPHLALIPGLLIIATVYSFNVLGNLTRRVVTVED